MTDQLRPRGGSAFLWVVVGAVIGLLVGVLVIPRHQSEVQVSSGSGIMGQSGGSSGLTGTGALKSGASSSPAETGSTQSGSSISGGGYGGPPAGGASAGPGMPGVAPAAGASSQVGPSQSPGTPAAGSTAANQANGAGSGAAGETPAGPVQGLTSSTIRIGIAYPDISALKALGPAYDNGNVPEQWNALIEGYRQQHLLPVGGRDIQLFFASYNVLDTNAQNAACRSLVEDDKVFAVIGVAYFQTGADCVTQQFHVPLITDDGPSDQTMAAGAPYLYSMEPSTGAILRNWVYWAVDNGYLNGKKVGVYYSTADPVSETDAQQNVIAVLKRLGHPPVATATTNDTNGGPEDAIAVQKFKAAGVTMVLPLSSIAGFLQQADVQDYHPKYLSSDYMYGTTDTATSTYQADQWNGTYATAETTEGGSAGGKPPGPGTTECVDNYNRQTGSNVQGPGSQGHETAVWGYIIIGCDEGQILMKALEYAGADLTPSRFIAGIRTIDDVSLRRVGDVNFTHRDWGADEQRTLQWQASCTCWRAVSNWAPLFTQ